VKKYVIIAAGGSGNRMCSNTPKQFCLLNNKPIVIHTMERFYTTDKKFEIILILPKNQILNWKNLCIKNNFNVRHTIVAGGKNRFESIKNGLKKVPKKGIVLIHDGVRPLISSGLIKSLIKIGIKNECVVPIIPIKDSVRKLEGNTSKAIDRSNLFSVQTPQCFKSELIKKAYKQTYCSFFTDDASVYESIGGMVTLIEGEESNIKITNKEDLKIVKGKQYSLKYY